MGKLTTSAHHVGLIGEAHFIEWASRQDWHLYRGFDGHAPCDFVADTGADLIKVEVKRVESVQASDKGYYYCLVSGLRTKDFDFLFVSTPDGRYWIPSEEVPGTLSLKADGPYKRNITRPGKYARFMVSP